MQNVHNQQNAKVERCEVIGMSEPIYKLSSLCAYQILNSYIDKKGEEVCVCRTPDRADTFEMTANTVQKHETINEITYLRVNAAQAYCRQGEYLFDDIALDAKAMAVIDQMDEDKHDYFVADFLNKTVETMSEEDVRELVLHKYRIPSEEIDGAMIYMRHSTSSNYNTLDDRDVFAGIVSSFMDERDEGLPEKPFIGVVVASTVEALKQQVETRKGKTFEDEVMLATVKAMVLDEELNRDSDVHVTQEQEEAYDQRHQLNDCRKLVQSKQKKGKGR